MSYSKLRSYSTNAISNILPLDRETCGEMVDYALTLPTDHEMQSHFLNLLGESEESLAFLTKFMNLKEESDREHNIKNEPKKSSNKTNKSLEHKSSSHPQKNQADAWTATQNKPKEKTNKGRLQNNDSSKMTSELIDLKPTHVETKPSKSSKKKTVDNLQDIEAVLCDLELSSKNDMDLEATTVVRRKCNCMAKRHPLFEVAPNCLNCGKIICAKEGLQPCSFCGRELLSSKDKWEIINLLRDEKNSIESKEKKLKDTNNKDQITQTTNKNKNKKIVITMNAGENLWKAQNNALKKMEADKKINQELLEKIKKEREEIAEQEKELKRYELTNNVNPDLLKAQERLETLLNFQATGAERTKIIDNASDFEMPNSSSGNMWLSPVERALHLKKQQKQLRKHDGIKSARSGRGNKTVEMVIKNGKVTMVEKQTTGNPTEDDGEDDGDMEDLESQIKDDKHKNESDLAKSIWDYDKYRNKWEKPVYIGSSNDMPDDVDPQAYKARVQFSNNADDNELLVSLPS